MKIIDKMLSLIGLQRKLGETHMQQIMRDGICDHKWSYSGDQSFPILYTRVTVRCLECNKEKLVSWSKKDELIQHRKTKEEYELNKQNNIDSLFQELVKNKEESQ